MVRLQRAVAVISIIWLLGGFALLNSVDSDDWKGFLLLYTLFGLIPVVALNGVVWVFKPTKNKDSKDV
jgi:hypothetical protein